VLWLLVGAMTRRREHRVAVMAKPVLVVVDDEDASLQALARELESRYGAHYRVVAGSSAEVALARLAELKAAGVMCRWCWPISGCRGWAGRSCWRG
jgi:hypothetical protein